MTEKDKLYADELRDRAYSDYERLDLAINELELQTNTRSRRKVRNQMQIVIDIDKDVYTRLFDNGIQDNEIAVDDVCEMARALRLGRPLEAQPQPCEDCISRQAVLDIITFEDKWLFDANGHNANTHIAFSGLESRVKALPPVTPQASEEDIHREREQAYMLGYEDASKKFRTEPCEDCISREAVIEHICEAKECYKEECKGRILKRCPDLQWAFDLPPVTPQRPKGKWIPYTEVDFGEFKGTKKYECSECGHRVGVFRSLFCPNCGSYNGGGEDEVSD